jgi:hypothetical protein
MSHDTNQFKGWLDREILEYSQVLIGQIEYMEGVLGQCVSAQATNACIDQIADIKGSLVACVSEMVRDLDE